MTELEPAGPATVDRAEVVTCARTWVGTAFQHQQRMKGVAVDCAGLVIGVARELGLVAPEFDITGYSRAPDGKSLIGWCDLYMARVPREQMQPGHVIVVAFDRDPQHMGILGDYVHGGLSIIHAYCTPDGKGQVTETRLMFSRALRFVAAYALPGVA